MIVATSIIYRRRIIMSLVIEFGLSVGMANVISSPKKRVRKRLFKTRPGESAAQWCVVATDTPRWRILPRTATGSNRHAGRYFTVLRITLLIRTAHAFYVGKNGEAFHVYVYAVGKPKGFANRSSCDRTATVRRRACLKRSHRRRDFRWPTREMNTRNRVY